MNSELRIALCQMELSWEDAEQNFRRVEELAEASGESWDILILPEMFSTGFTMKPEILPPRVGEKTLDWMKGFARSSGAAITGSTVYRTADGFVNRLLFVDPNDDEVRIYDKRHLFTLAGEQHHYVPGEELLILDYKGFRICPLICYDLRFPVWSRNVSGYDLLLYVANWPVPRIQAWDVLLRARAIENMAYCAGVNRIGSDEGGHQYSGHSVMVDPLGNVIRQLEGEEIRVFTLEKNILNDLRSRLRFLDDRDHFTLLD
jgi:predicted amidohydrolase